MQACNLSFLLESDVSDIETRLGLQDIKDQIEI
jgi:hypothetical protein